MTCAITSDAEYREEQRSNRNSTMDTTKTKDKAERKKLKRAARNEAPPKAKRTDPRGSHKRKVKKRGPGQAARR